LVIAGAMLTVRAVAIKLEFYGQAGCSHCYAFMTGALKKLLADPEFASKIDFEYFPYGNAYFVTKKCKGDGDYDIMPRKCWDANCGRGATDRPGDCFGPGELVCQNGPAECDADRYVACAKRAAGMEHAKYLPYAECVDGAFEGNPHGDGLDVEGLASKCAASSGLDSGAIRKCFAGPDGDAAVKAEGVATPPHGFCPVVVVGGTALQWGTEGNILGVVCGQLPAPKPSACTAAAAPSPTWT